MSDERRLLERMVALANDVGKGLGALPDDSAGYDMVKGIVGDAEAYSRFRRTDQQRTASASG